MPCTVYGVLKVALELPRGRVWGFDPSLKIVRDSTNGLHWGLLSLKPPPTLFLKHSSTRYKLHTEVFRLISTIL